MEFFEKLKLLWPSVKPILLPYDGMASQLYVLDVPRAELERVLDHFCRNACSAVIVTLNGFTFEPAEQVPCDIVSRAELLRTRNQSSQSIVRGKFIGGRTIQFWIWPDKSGHLFDAEFVFWADEFFPSDQHDSEHVSSFQLVYSLAEMTRENHPECECVLSASEAGDPREHRDAGWTRFW